MFTVIFDIDSTLLDLSHRLHHIEGDEKNWDAFHKDCIDDAPIQDTIRINNALHSVGNTIVLMTGREERTRKDTIDSCHKHGIKWDFLLMRKNGNRQLDTIIKAKMYADHVLNVLPPVLCVFEDRNRVVKMWRDLGITCYHVIDGDY